MSSTDAARAGRQDADRTPERTRRTVVIRGQVAPAPRIPPRTDHRGRRRPPRPLHERAGSRPDRVALYAFLLGIALILAAALSAQGPA